MMGKRFARIVEECLHRLDRGENLPDVLADYPAEADQLKPLLLVAMASRSMALPVPNQTAQRLGRSQMMAEMDQMGSRSALRGDTIQYRLKVWATRARNTLRSRGLIRPAPSYRLAMVALLVIFGSGWFILSASASPGDLITAFAADIQAVLDIFDGGSSEHSQDYFRQFTIFSENFFPFSASRAVKVVFQLDFMDDNENSEFAASNAGMNPAGRSPGEIPGLIPDQHPDQDLSQEDPTQEESTPEDPAPTSPFPGQAAEVVDEVVSDTAKEKNPVWDELPFNQIDPDTDDDSAAQDDGEDQEDDQDQDDEKVKDKKPKKDKIDLPDDDEGVDGEGNDGDD